MMDKYIIKEHTQRFWQVAELFKNGKKIADINKFYDVTPDWIFIYGTIGGTGTGFIKGDILAKIYIGDSEFCKEYIR